MNLYTYRYRYRSLLMASASMLALSGHGAHAYEIPLDGIVITSSKTEESAIDALGGSSAVKKEQIDQQFQPDRVSEMLSIMPGVAVSETAGDTAQSINIRGLQDFGRVNVLVDGMRQNFQRSGHHADGAFYLEPEMVRGVDVTRGPTSTIYGSGAIGGVAEFGLLSASDILKGDESTALRLKSRYSSNGEGWLNSATGAIRIGNFDMLGQINGRDFGDYTDGGGNTIPASGEETKSGLVKARWHADGHEVTGTLIDYNSEFVQRSVNPGSGAVTLRDSDLHNRQYSLGYTFARPDVSWADFSAKIYRNETDLGQMTQTGSDRSFNVATEGVDVSNTSRFSTGSVGWALTYGADGFQDAVKTVDDAGFDVLTPDGKRTVAGAFFQSKANWSIFELIGAVRYDTYELDGGGTHAEGSRASPKVTLGVTPIDGLTVFTTYAEGYRAPAITETLIQGLHPPVGGPRFGFLPNPDLRPEVAHNVEGGVNLKYNNVFTANDAFRAKVTVFQNKVDDYIDMVSVPMFRYQYQNIAKATLEGIEFESGYDAKTWFLGLSAHRIRGTNDTDGTPLTSAPADQVALTAGVRWLDGTLVTGARTRIVAAQDRVIDATLATDGYFVADIFAQYNYSDDLVFNLNVDNVFDKEYQQYLNQSNSPGINAKFGMTMRLGGS